MSESSDGLRTQDATVSLPVPVLRKDEGTSDGREVDKKADRVRAHLAGSADITRRVERRVDAILAAADLLIETFRAGGKVLLCGNGGSAADCQHLAAEFMGRLHKEVERPGLPAVALTTDTSFLTAFANDSGYDGVFASQVFTLGKPGDVLIGISTSGASHNILHAFEAARSRGMRTVALTGAAGELAQLAEVTIAVPSANSQHIQETHLAIEHVLADLVEFSLFGGKVSEEEP